MTAVRETTAQPQVHTPPLRTTARRWLFWVAFAVIAIVVALVAFLGAGANRPLGVPLDPESPGPAGAKALIEVLRDQGVDVTVTASLDETRDALGGREATVVLHDRAGILDEAAARDALLGDHLVVIEPTFDVLQAVAPDVAHAGSVTDVLESDCSVGAVERAGTVTGDGVGYRHLDPDDAVELCLGSGDGIVSLVRFDDGSRTVSVVGATDAMSNGSITEEGNAAFALGLLGEHPALVWYVPGPDDIAGPPGAGELTPPWVTPVLVLIVLVVIAAGVAQGRRLGPLVVENLPVTVRATETMEGRARLYQRSSARLRALDALRVGTVQRLASRVRLPHSAPVEQVADLVAATVQVSPQSVRALLVDTLPRTDRELIELSDRLLELERAVAEATTP